MHQASELKDIFESYLRKKSFVNQPDSLYVPINYILELPGKRFRPVLVLLSYEMYNEHLEKALPIAMAVELFHNFTLIHDDIMDEASLRRGKKSVHTKYGVNTGILSGDVMVIYAYKYLMDNASKNQYEILRLFNLMSIEVCEGQQSDMDFESSSNVSITEYLEMIEKKTSVLIGAALAIGALSGGADSKDANHLYQYGINLGIAFQIQDDVLDVYGEPVKFGKRVGGDILQAKKTYLYLKSLELLSEEDRILFQELYNSNPEENSEKVQKVKSVFDELNVLEYARQTQDAYAQLADSHLASVSVDPEKKSELINFSSQLFKRQV